MEPDHETPAENSEAPPTPPNWVFQKDFKINDLTKDLIRQTIAATEQEIAKLYRQVEKLTYGT